MRNIAKKYDWVTLTDNLDWSIDNDVRLITGGLSERGLSTLTLNAKDRLPLRTGVLFVPALPLLTFPSGRRLRFCDRLVVNCYHGDYGITSNMDRNLDRIMENEKTIHTLIVSCEIMRTRFINWGFSDAKIQKIPIGIDLSQFVSGQESEKYRLRERLGLPKNGLVVGSFQKDGVGWGDGLEPKLIKGPDVFVDVCKKLQNNVDFSVLLSGPARGYVEKELEKYGINVVSLGYLPFQDIPSVYRAVDMVMMCSREEGGPKSILESLAADIPFVATRVGMAPDLEKALKSGWFADPGDVERLADLAYDCLTDQNRRQLWKQEARELKYCYDYGRMTSKYLSIFEKF